MLQIVQDNAWRRVARLAARKSLEAIAREAGTTSNTVRVFELDPGAVNARTREKLEPVYRALAAAAGAPTLGGPPALKVAL